MSLGSRLKLARIAKKLTQKQLGALAGVTGSAIGNYENGFSNPNEDVLIRLMAVLGVDANYLYADDMAAISNARFLSPEEENLITLYRALNGAGQTALLSTAQTFAGNPALSKDIHESAI